MANHVWMTLSTTTLNSVGDTSPPCVVPCVAKKPVPRNPFRLGANFCWTQKVSKSLQRQGPAPYTSKVRMRHYLSTVEYVFLMYRDTRKRGLWSMMAISCARLSSIILVPVPLPTRNLRRMLYNWKVVLRQVSIRASTTFQRVSSSPMPQVSVFPLGMRTKIVYP